MRGELVGTDDSPTNEAKRRDEFLMKMYDQMFNDINRNVLVVWQSVGVLVGTLAVFALVEKGIVTLDFATTFVVLISGWSVAHLYEATYWYNRNLAIIANIERQFLRQHDLRDIHYYFGEHRKVNKMLDQFKIQYTLALGVAASFLLLHFFERVLPGIGGSWRTFQFSRALPYMLVIAVIILIVKLKKRYEGKYREFLQNSPGIAVDTTGVIYGIGHPIQELSSTRSALQLPQEGAGPRPEHN